MTITFSFLIKRRSLVDKHTERWKTINPSFTVYYVYLIRYTQKYSQIVHWPSTGVRGKYSQFIADILLVREVLL